MPSAILRFAITPPVFHRGIIRLAPRRALTFAAKTPTIHAVQDGIFGRPGWIEQR